MPQHFCNKFKELRKARDLTQDQIADIFHVSPQSVSRWETGINYPDVEILPFIAGFFNVTVDELLGTELILSEEKVKGYMKDIRYLLNSGKLHGSIELARKAVREIPVSYELQSLLIQTLCEACNQAKEDRELYKDEIIKIGERAIRYCTDQDLCLELKHTLFRQYAWWGMKEEAKKILMTMPKNAWHTREYCAGELLEGEEWREHQRLSIIRTNNLLCMLIDRYAYDADLHPIKKVERLKAHMHIEREVYSITDLPRDFASSALINIYIAMFYCDACDGENAMHHVEQAVKDCISNIEQVLRPEEGENMTPWATPSDFNRFLREDELTKPCFDFIRDTERFVKCIELLKSY